MQIEFRDASDNLHVFNTYTEFCQWWCVSSTRCLRNMLDRETFSRLNRLVISNKSRIFTGEVINRQA
jgi:hypothetical protein